MSGYTDPCFLDPDTSWRWVISFTLRPPYPRGKSPRYSLDRRLVRPRNRFGRRGENSWPYRHLNSVPSVAQPVVSRYTDCAISVPVFLRNYSKFTYNIYAGVADLHYTAVNFHSNFLENKHHNTFIDDYPLQLAVEERPVSMLPYSKLL
jgi:hypothetical protein